MLKVTNKKAQQYSMQHKISSHYLDLESFDETLFDKKFDLVFSNFGGLNCINPESLQSLITKLPRILNPGGRFIAVAMPKFCLWECLYFLLKFNIRKAFRRNTSKSVLTNLHGTTLSTWYYTPSQLRKWSAGKFQVNNLLPIGITLPPSYLEPFFKVHKRMLLRLNKMEKRFSGHGFFAPLSDHFIIDLQLK